MLEFGAAVSTRSGHQQALDEVVPAALRSLGGPPDLAVCFFTMDYADHADGIALSLSERTGTSNVIGCTGEAVIADGRELEDGPALSLWLARLPGVEVHPFALRVVPLEDGVAIAGWPALEPDQRAAVLMFAEPFSFPTDRFLEHLNGERPRVTVVGGVASGGVEPGQHRLFSGGTALETGAVGVAMVGPVDVRTLVSQGCRPIGQPFTVTKSDGNVVEELGGRPAVERLRELVTELDVGDQLLLRGGALQVGQVVDEQKLDYDRGDFLIRPLAGADPSTGSIALSEEVAVGRTLQFHLRDAAAADEELEVLLEPVADWQPKGVLLFSCNGRGRGFFGAADHDAAMVRKATGSAPMSGFFAGGELGPVGGRNFRHGFTASMAVFCEPSDHGPGSATRRTAVADPFPTDPLPPDPFPTDPTLPPWPEERGGPDDDPEPV